jgi:putative ABC transport system permease protein
MKFGGLTRACSVKSPSIDQSDNRNPNISGGKDSYGGELRDATMRLRGGYTKDFDEGYRELADGEMPDADGECIVSTDFAELNGISAGDAISVTAGLYDSDGETQTVEIPLTVVGTYYDVTEEYSGTAIKAAYQNRRNEILTTFDTVANAGGDALTGVAVNAVYYLKSPDLLSAFEAEIRGKGLPDDYNVSTDTASYERMVSPVEGMRDISLTFLLIVLAFGAAIIILLSVIAIRERKYEIGVLRAVGMKKKQVALALWTEIIAVTCICFVIGLGVGAAVSQPVSDILLTEQLQEAEQPNSFLNRTQVEPIDEIDVTVDAVTALEIFGISILLASIAGVISVSRIIKYEPIKILMERN